MEEHDDFWDLDDDFCWDDFLDWWNEDYDDAWDDEGEDE